MAPNGSGTSRVMVEPPARVVLASMAAFTVVFLTQVLVAPFARFAQQFLALNTATFLKRLCLWQPLTAAFLHSCVLQFVVNVLLFWVFGNGLANAWRPREFVRYVGLCAIGGGVGVLALMYLFADPRGAAGMGANGIVFGRNIFLAENPPLLTEALNAVMNEGLEPEKAAAKYGLK